MQDPFGRLPAPDSYAGSTAPSITGFSGHPTRFSRFRASPRDTDDSYFSSRPFFGYLEIDEWGVC